MPDLPLKLAASESGSPLAGRDPDAVLMQALGRGDLNALAVLVRRHQNRVRCLAFRFTGRWDQADDITQEAFLRVHRSAARYQPAAAFSTWLYRIVVNLCLDAAKKPRLARIDDIDPPAVPAADEQSATREKQQAVANAVAQLPERQRIAVLLHRFENMSCGQIAHATGWTESAVESLLSRAYSRLREILQPWREG